MDTFLIQTLQKGKEAMPKDNTGKAMRLYMLLGGGVKINMVGVEHYTLSYWAH